MAEQVGASFVAKSKNLSFSLTNSLRGEKVNIDSYGGNFFIDIHGQIFKLSEPSSESASIIVEGGLDTFINEKQYREPIFYLTQKQKNIIYNILRELSILTDVSNVSSPDSEILDRLVSSTYFNYCG